MLLREVHLLLLISLSGGQETFMGLRNSLGNSGLARGDEIKWTQSLPYTSYLPALPQWDNKYGIMQVGASKHVLINVLCISRNTLKPSAPTGPRSASTDHSLWIIPFPT